MTNTRQTVNLYQILDHYFNDSELHDLCFRLGVDYEDLQGDSKKDKARELVEYCRRYGRIDELAETTRRLRPNANRENTSKVSPAPIAIIMGVIIALAMLVILAQLFGFLEPKTSTPFMLSPSTTQSPPVLSIPPITSAILKVQVQDRLTGKNVQNAKVVLQAGVKPSLIALTDSEGVARLFVDVELVGQPGNLTVEANGYIPCKRDIEIKPQSDQIIVLELKP